MPGFWRKLFGLEPAQDPTTTPGPLLDDRPADGTIEVRPVDGFSGEPIAPGSRFVRFTTMAAVSPATVTTSANTRQALPQLRGRIVLASLFIGRDGQSWSDHELSQAHRALERAATWIERQAVRHGAPLNLVLPSVCFSAQDPVIEDVAIDFLPEGDAFGPHERDADWRATASASRAAAALGFVDLADLDSQLVSRLPCDGHAWVLHLRRAGRSFAIGIDHATLPGVPIAVTYAREASFSEPLDGPPFVDPVTIVHELMHLFGASDKYGVAFDTFAPGDVTSRDVMLLATESLARLRVDPLTAREVGWSSPPGRLPQ